VACNPPVETCHMMKTNTRSLLAGVCGVAVLLMGGPLSWADEQDDIDYRQHIMKTLQEQAESISMIIQHRAPAENLGAHAKLLVLSAGTARKSFDSKAPGGNAKSEIWTNMPDFVKRMDALVAAADDLLKASGAGVQAASAKNQALMATCKSCHDVYMTPKK
jgi:cytochrome c556